MHSGNQEMAEQFLEELVSIIEKYLSFVNAYLV
jgi:hypothetical protein